MQPKASSLKQREREKDREASVLNAGIIAELYAVKKTKGVQCAGAREFCLPANLIPAVITAAILEL